MSHRLGRVGRSSIAAATIALVVLSFGTAGRVAAAEPRSMSLVDQSFNVKPHGSIGVTVDVPSTIDLTEAATFKVVVATYTPVASRQQVSDAIRGRLPELIDQVTFEGTKVIRPGTQRLDLIVPLVTDHPTVGALYYQHSGVYPLTVTLIQDGTDLARLVSFVHRLPDTDETEEDPLQVAMAMSAPMAATFDDGIHVVLDDTAATSVAHMADAVAVSSIPVSVRVPPAVIAGLANGTKQQVAVVQRLAAAIQNHTLLSSPALPMNASALAEASQQSLYTQWLRSGEDQLGQALSSPAQRSVALVDDLITTKGATMLRDLGTRLFVVSPTLFDNLPYPHPTIGDTASTLVQARVGTDSMVTLAISDRRFQRLLGEPSANTALTAIYGVADLMAARQEIVDDGDLPHRHGITLAAPDLGVPNADVLGAVSTLIADTPGLRPTTLDDLGVRIDTHSTNGNPDVVDLPVTTSASVAHRVGAMNLLRLGITSTSSMLNHDDPRTGEWKRLLDALPSSAIDDAQAARITASISTALDAIKAQVVAPDGFSFNLTGKKGTVPVSIRNNADVPLTVRVRMSSSKLRFPNGDRIVTLAPRSYTEVRIDMEIRSNGRFPVSLEVFTPTGNTRLGPAVPLTANVGGLSGLGNLVTGAGALVVLTWWARHLRANRRKRLAQRSTHGHPSTGLEVVEGDPTPVSGIAVDPTGVSPDAATSTLPDS